MQYEKEKSYQQFYDSPESQSLVVFDKKFIDVLSHCSVSTTGSNLVVGTRSERFEFIVTGSTYPLYRKSFKLIHDKVLDICLLAYNISADEVLELALSILRNDTLHYQRHNGLAQDGNPHSFTYVVKFHEVH